MKAIHFILPAFRLPARIAGADFSQFSAILKTRLTLDGRTEYITQANSKYRTFIYQLLLIALFGLFFGLILVFSDIGFAGLITIFYSGLMFITGMTLITEYTSVLFDRRDNHILLPRPVSRRTLLFSRLVHIQLYSGLITLAFSLTAIIVVAIKYNLGVLLAFLVSILLISWLTVWSTIIVYLVISRIFEREKFKDIINYLQIVMAILFTVAYQFIGKIEADKLFSNIDFHSWFTFLIPPFWFAGLMDSAVRGFQGMNTHDIIMSIMALILPAAGVVFLIRYMSAGFERTLSSLDAENPSDVRSAMISKPLLLIRDFLCNDTAEKAGWSIVMASTARDRKFKATVYPGFFVLIFFGILLMFPKVLTNSGAPMKFGYIAGIIMCGMSGMSAFRQLKYSESHTAAWIYRALPVTDHGSIYRGLVKAVFVKFYFPVHVIAFTAIVLIKGPQSILPSVLALTGTYMLTLLMLLMQGPELPYSESYDNQEKGGATVTGILTMIFALLLGAIVFLTTHIPAWLTLLIIALVAAGSVILLKNTGRRLKI